MRYWVRNDFLSIFDQKFLIAFNLPPRRFHKSRGTSPKVQMKLIVSLLPVVAAIKEKPLCRAGKFLLANSFVINSLTLLMGKVVFIGWRNFIGFK